MFATASIHSDQWGQMLFFRFDSQQQAESQFAEWNRQHSPISNSDVAALLRETLDYEYDVSVADMSTWLGELECPWYDYEEKYMCQGQPYLDCTAAWPAPKLCWYGLGPHKVCTVHLAQ